MSVPPIRKCGGSNRAEGKRRCCPSPPFETRPEPREPGASEHEREPGADQLDRVQRRVGDEVGVRVADSCMVRAPTRARARGQAIRPPPMASAGQLSIKELARQHGPERHRRGERVGSAGTSRALCRARFAKVGSRVGFARTYSPGLPRPPSSTRQPPPFLRPYGFRTVSASR
jgi:hypothetical protein